jgi:hypothetical protein
MNADWWARGIAIAGLVVAAVSLGWNVFMWRRQGPVLRVKATCTGRGSEMKISGIIRNVGRYDAQIDRVWVQWTSTSPGGTASGQQISTWIEAEHISGVTLKMELPAQRGYEFTVTGIYEIDRGLDAALHDRRRAQIGFVTATGKKAGGTIRYK